MSAPTLLSPKKLDVSDRLRFEMFVSDLAAGFQRLPASQLDEAIGQSLRGLVEMLDVDRCSISQLLEDGTSHRATHGFSRPGIRPPELRLELATALPWYTEQLRRGHRLVFTRLPEGLPEEARAERSFALSTGMKSHVALPLRVDREIIGGLGIGTFSEHRELPPEFLSRLDLVASVFASALYRRRAEERLREAEGIKDQALAALETSLAEIRDLKERLEAENVGLQLEIREAHGFDEIVGTSPVLAAVLEQVQQVAQTDAPVLLLGETGTGKDLVARALHERSRRRLRRLVIVNCAALPGALVESELFGYEKGAFTGAFARTPGRFEVADGGSLLLDEIGELPLEVQAKLLRVLQTGEFERLGSSKTLRTDVRLIAATNRDLEREVREGRFRPDLFYRLNVFPLTLPPLRQRPEDIPLLVWHFIARKQAGIGRHIEKVPDRLMRALQAYAWPGNIRELDNVVERAMILSKGPVLAMDPLFGSVAPEGDRSETSVSLAEFERAHVLAVLRECGFRIGGRGNAAERLGLNRSTLQSRMKKLGIERPATAGRLP